MRCFIHNEAEAIATCRTCGKAMCAQCSAYSGHSGICPQCRKEEFKREVSSLYYSIDEYKRSRFWNIVLAVLLCFTIIVPLVVVFLVINTNSKIEKAEARICILNKEISKLDKALISRGTKAFV